MFARSRKIKLSDGVEIQTPMLIPSFSSKGFRVNKGISESKQMINELSELIIDYQLVSAYDIYYNNTPNVQKLSKMVDVTFIDSGGYEISTHNDCSTIFHLPIKKEKWDKKKHQEVLNSWPLESDAIIVNHDNERKRYKLEDQAKFALKFFDKNSRFLNDFLIKPENSNKTKKDKNNYINPDNICSKIECLKGFDIVGFTEKEIGKSFQERMINIARIRLAMDKSEINSPIHIFGSLDPISSWLYFIAGAEIFDGLTWLRYAYKEGICIYRQNYNFTKFELDMQEERALIRMQIDNINELVQMQSKMKTFVVNKCTINDIPYMSKNIMNSINKVKKIIEEGNR